MEPNERLLDVCHTGYYEKKMAKTFFFGTIAFNLKTFVLDFSGPKERIKKLAQNVSKDPV